MGNLCSRPNADEGFADLHVCAEQQVKTAFKQAQSETPQKQAQPQLQDAAGAQHSSSQHSQLAACAGAGKGWPDTGKQLDVAPEPSDRQRRESNSSIMDSAYSVQGRNFLEWIQNTSEAMGQDLGSFILDNMAMDSSSTCGCPGAAASSFSNDSAYSSSTSNAQLASKIQAAASAHGLTLEAVQAAVRAARAASGDSAAAVAPFKRFDGYVNGAPRPACWDERHATAKAINSLKQLRDGEIESMLRLLCHKFEVDTATVALLTGECIYLTGACGALPVCVCPDRWGFCGWSFLNPNHELVVVEDMEKDARFSENYFVVSPEFRLVFYCMAPLISSNNNRIGTLCIMGQQPRSFDATRGQLLANLAEMIVRQLEHSWAMRMCSALGTNSNLMRSIACYGSAYLFVEVVDDAWRVMHMNPAAIDLLGAKWVVSYDDLPKVGEGRFRQPFRGTPMQELFDVHHAGEEWLPGKWEFVLRGVCGAMGSSVQDVHFDLHFRLSTSDGLDADQPIFVGVPSWLPVADDGFGTSSFFVRIEHAAPPRASMDRSRSIDKARVTPPGTPPCSSAGQMRRSSGGTWGSGATMNGGSLSRSRRNLGDGSKRGSLESTRCSLDSTRCSMESNRNSLETSRDKVDAANTVHAAEARQPSPAKDVPQADATSEAPVAHMDHVKHVKAIAAPSSPKHSQPPQRAARNAVTMAFAALTLTDTAVGGTAVAPPAADTASAPVAEAPAAAEPAAAAAAIAGGATASQAAATSKQRLANSLDLPRAKDKSSDDSLSLSRQVSAPLTPGTSEPGTPRLVMPAMQALAKRSITGAGAVMSGGQVPWGVRGVSAAPIDGLMLGPLMGKGSFGRVYRGIYKGAPCAVKIVDNLSSVRRNAAGEPLEAALTCGLHHLGLMRTLKFAYADAATDAYSSPAVKMGKTCWMVFEHCNKGCVSDAVVKGWFRTSSKPTEGGTNLRAVAMTAYEVASAMTYLHSQGVTHGDLCGGNVMLHASSINAHGFTAKVGDFGMVREASANLLSRPNAYGTITHMPPEVLLDAKVSPAMDVYAFGVLFWEMLTSSRAWAGLRHAQIVMQAAVMKRQLEAPPGLPAPLLKLLQACLTHDAAKRCTFKEAVAVLGDYLQAHTDVDSTLMELPLCCSEPAAA